MKTPHMKSLAAMSLIALTVALSPQAKGVTLINYNFNSLTTGTSIHGQDSWVSVSGSFNTPPQVATTPVNAGGGGTTGLTNGLEDKGSSARKNFFTAGTLTTSQTLTLTFDAIQVTNQTIAQFGLGDGTANFGIWNGTMAIRSSANTFIAKTNAGWDVAPINNHWYSFQSVWNLSTNMASLYYKDLTNGDTSYTQLFFDQAQTVSQVSLGSFNPATVTDAWVRVGKTGAGGVGPGTGYLDNLSLVAVPEPHTLALGLLGLGTFLAMRFRRRAS
ncbi:MAG: PEP-CTERM sorting domain-containing protein [Chthoniobacterales bacterium]|nr:PEP-CTERM sorting domain-containing protein [Chthoniobacterales bacterium]